MIVVVLRHTVRLVHDRHGRRGGRPLGTLNPPLHLAHRVQVVAHHVLIARAELTLQLLHALGDGIKDAAVDLHLGTPYPRGCRRQPNSRWNTTRGSRSCGSGKLGVRHDVEFQYAQL